MKLFLEDDEFSLEERRGFVVLYVGRQIVLEDVEKWVQVYR